MEETRVPGYFLTGDIDFLKQHAGVEGLTKLEKMLPDFDIKKLSPIKRYSLHDEMRLLKAIMHIIYGNDSPESWEKIGMHEFDTVRESSLAKVLFSLWGGSFKFLVQNGGKMFSFFAPFVTYTPENITDSEADITIENDPYPKEYYRGVFRSVLLGMCGSEKVTVTDEGNGKHVYHISIDKPAV